MNKKHKPKLIPHSVIVAEMRKRNPNYDQEFEWHMKYFKLLEDLHRLRKQKKLTQKKLAELSGVPQETISRIESGVREPELKTIAALAASLGKKVEITLK